MSGMFSNDIYQPLMNSKIPSMSAKIYESVSQWVTVMLNSEVIHKVGSSNIRVEHCGTGTSVVTHWCWWQTESSGYWVTRVFENVAKRGCELGNWNTARRMAALKAPLEDRRSAHSALRLAARGPLLLEARRGHRRGRADAGRCHPQASRRWRRGHRQEDWQRIGRDGGGHERRPRAQRGLVHPLVAAQRRLHEAVVRVGGRRLTRRAAQVRGAHVPNAHCAAGGSGERARGAGDAANKRSRGLSFVLKSRATRAALVLEYSRACARDRRTRVVLEAARRYGRRRRAQRHGTSGDARRLLVLEHSWRRRRRGAGAREQCALLLPECSAGGGEGGEADNARRVVRVGRGLHRQPHLRVAPREKLLLLL